MLVVALTADCRRFEGGNDATGTAGDVGISAVWASELGDASDTIWAEIIKYSDEFLIYVVNGVNFQYSPL